MAAKTKKKPKSLSNPKEEAKDTKENAEATTTAPVREDEIEETLFQTFHRHPVVRITAVVLLPYLLYNAYFYVLLQKPHWVSARLRPAIVGPDFTHGGGERQLLIVGTMSSGTVQIAKQLKSNFKLEMGHESSNAHWEFVRDGTVSWFHGIRYLQPPETTQERFEAINPVCKSALQGDNMGFHPNMYHPPFANCSFRDRKSSCWTKECFRAFLNEWGCALRNDCTISFRRVLHQIRHPVRTIESLVAKFCVGGMTGELQPPFLLYMTALFSKEHDFHQDTCIEASAEYVYLYTTALLQHSASTSSAIHSHYVIETVSPCHLVTIAGLTSINSTVYPPNYHRISELCLEDNPFTQNLQQPVPKGTQNTYNKDFLRLTWADLNGGMHGSARDRDDFDLTHRIQQLTRYLGYNTEEDDQPDDGHCGDFETDQEEQDQRSSNEGEL